MIIKTIAIFISILTSIISFGQNQNIDILNYTINLTVNDTSNIIFAREKIVVKFTDHCTFFTLDLTDKKRNGSGMVVREIRTNLDTLTFSHENDKLTLFHNAIKSDTTEFVISYDGIPSDGLVISKNKFENRTFFGDNWPNRAHHWFACNDHPSDKATVTFSVTAPNIYNVISNGTKLSETESSEETKTTVYKSKFDLPTKVMVVGIAQFSMSNIETNHTTNISAWVYPEDEATGFSDMQVAKDPFSFFVKNIGPYPFEKLANVQSTTRFGGMENAGCIFYDENAINGKGTMENLIAHEIAHQWFGNSASESDWPHLWLSEGFATYFTNLHIENKYGRLAMNEQLEKDRTRIIKFSKQFRRPLVDTITTDLMQLLNPYAYQKGSWVLHMLRYKIGDELFWTGIRKYYDTYKYSNASSEQFVSIMQTMSDHDLSNFFNQWLKRDYHPQLKIKQRKFFGAKKIKVKQLQPNELFDLELEVAIGFKNDDVEIHKLVISSQQKMNKFKFKKRIVQINVDPNKNLLFERIN